MSSGKDKDNVKQKVARNLYQTLINESEKTNQNEQPFFGLICKKLSEISIGNKRVYKLSYADDLAITAETKEEMEKMIKYLNKYFKDKEMEVNAEKSKIMVLGKRKIRKKGEWKCKDYEIEEVREFKYLGCTFKYNKKNDAHIQDLRKRAAAATVQIRSIRERKFGGDFKYMHVRGRNMGHIRRKRNRKYTRKVSKEYSKIREMDNRLPGKRGDENRKDYGRGRRESN